MIFVFFQVLIYIYLLKNSLFVTKTLVNLLLCSEDNAQKCHACEQIYESSKFQLPLRLFTAMHIENVFFTYTLKQRLSGSYLKLLTLPSQPGWTYKEKRKIKTYQKRLTVKCITNILEFHLCFNTQQLFDSDKLFNLLSCNFLSSVTFNTCSLLCLIVVVESK